MKNCLKHLLPFAFVMSMAGAAYASMLSEPTGPVILTVSGSISETNDGAAAKFDRAMLKGMDWQSVESYTTWTDGATTFGGVNLSTLLEAVGADGTTITAVALNDYSVRIPVSDATRYDVLLAMEMNGKQMKIRDKGPIWIVYPQTKEQVKEPQFDEKMIWQLKTIEVGN